MTRTTAIDFVDGTGLVRPGGACSECDTTRGPLSSLWPRFISMGESFVSYVWLVSVETATVKQITDRLDRDFETEQNVHFKAFDLCLRARELGMTLEETEQAFRDQWERTEQVHQAMKGNENATH